MVPVKKIVLDRAEGPSDECFSRTFKSFDEADSALRKWSWSTKGAYDKVDFEITFKDGETYKGRYDMVHNDPGRLREHVLEFLGFYGGVLKPDHMTDQAYKEFLSREALYPEAPKQMDYLRFAKKYIGELPG